MSRKRKKTKHEAGPDGPDGNDAKREEPPSEEATGLEASDPPETSTPSNDSEPSELLAELERLGKEASEMRDIAQRTRAEFENYRKRVDRERSELARHAGFDVVKEVLPVLDNLERAIQASESSPEEQFRAGVEIIHRQFQEILARQGLSEVESQGKPFDPHVHEAVSRVETEEHPEGTIVEVFQKGYLFKDRLLRPAMVSVAQSSGGGEPETPRETEGEEETVRKKE